MKLEKSDNKNPMTPPPIINTHLNILFHHYRYHKKSLTALRVWSIAKLISPRYCGAVNLNEVLPLVKISEQYFLKHIFHNSEFFRAIDGQKLYLTSYRKIKKLHHLGKSIIRREKMTKRFIGQYRSKANFEGYILKCYMEIDLRRKLKRFTVGRISYEMVAKYFNISRRTAISLLLNSTAKILVNKLHLPHIRFKARNEFGNWLLNNMEKRINGYRVGDNPNSYSVVESKDDFYLIQTLPNIYRFTGVCLVGRIRGNSNYKKRDLFK